MKSAALSAILSITVTGALASFPARAAATPDTIRAQAQDWADQYVVGLDQEDQWCGALIRGELSKLNELVQAMLTPAATAEAKSTVTRLHPPRMKTATFLVANRASLLTELNELPGPTAWYQTQDYALLRTEHPPEGAWPVKELFALVRKRSLADRARWSFHRGYEDFMRDLSSRAAWWRDVAYDRDFKQEEYILVLAARARQPGFTRTTAVVLDVRQIDSPEAAAADSPDLTTFFTPQVPAQTAKVLRFPGPR